MIFQMISGPQFTCSQMIVSFIGTSIQYRTATPCKKTIQRLWHRQNKSWFSLPEFNSDTIKAQALDKGPWVLMYMVPGNCTPFGWQTTEGSPGWTWQAGGGSFLLLPRRHALSSRWLWTFNHNMHENGLEEVQGSATNSLFTPPLFQNTCPCVQLLCAKHNAPCQWDLAIDKAKPPTSAAKWQGNDQTDLQRQATRHCHHQLQWATCSAWHWGPHWRREDYDGMDM